MPLDLFCLQQTLPLVLFATDPSTCFVCNRSFDLFCMQQILRLVLFATDSIEDVCLGFLTHMEMSPLPVKNFHFDLYSTLMASEVLWRITPTVTLSISLQWSFPRTHDTCTFGSETVTTCDYDFGLSRLGFDSNAKLSAYKANALTDRGGSILEIHENKKERGVLPLHFSSPELIAYVSFSDLLLSVIGLSFYTSLCQSVSFSHFFLQNLWAIFNLTWN